MNQDGPYYFATWHTASNKYVPPELNRLKFGDKLIFRYKGRSCIALYADYGPNERTGRYLDLGQNVANYLGLPGVGDVEWDFVADGDRLLPEIPNPTQADLFVQLMKMEVGDPYDWGGVASPDESADEPNPDCSGLGVGALRYAGVDLLKLTGANRPTAEVFYHARRAVLKEPQRVGDYAVLLNSSGRAHHIVWYIGNRQWTEAPRTGTTVRYLDSAEVHKRGFIVCKAPWDLGLLTGAAPPMVVCRVGPVTARFGRFSWRNILWQAKQGQKLANAPVWGAKVRRKYVRMWGILPLYYYTVYGWGQASLARSYGAAVNGWKAADMWDKMQAKNLVRLVEV